MSERKRVLPADVYDTLEFAALVFGGIADGPPFKGPERCPTCAHGLAIAAVGDPRTPSSFLPIHFDGGWGEVSQALYAAGISGYASDRAVRDIRRRQYPGGEWDYDARVSFAEWAAELGVVRGDS